LILLGFPSGQEYQFKGEAKRTMGFRKHYKTEAEESGMKSIHVEVAHGHSIGVSDHYYRPKPSDILDDYMMHAADALTVSSEHRLKKQIHPLESEHSAEWKALKQEMHKLKREIIRFRPWGEKNLPREEFDELLREEYEEKRKAKEGRLF
jgi:hypothetical protein